MAPARDLLALEFCRDYSLKISVGEMRKRWRKIGRYLARYSDCTALQIYSSH